MLFQERLVLNYLLLQGQEVVESQSPLFLHIVPNHNQAMLRADFVSQMHHLIRAGLFTQQVPQADCSKSQEIKSSRIYTG